MPDGNSTTHLAVRAEDITVLPWDRSSGHDLRARLEGLIPVGSHVIAELTLNGTTRLEAALIHADASTLERHLAADVAVRIAPERVLFLTDANSTVAVERQPGVLSRTQVGDRGNV